MVQTCSASTGLGWMWEIGMAVEFERTLVMAIGKEVPVLATHLSD